MDHVTIFRTGRLWEIDMARDALKRANIPYFARQENLSGIRFAFPAWPTPDVGVIWVILVPEGAVKDAKTILTQLPLELEKNPGFWDFTSHPGVIRGYKIFIWTVLAGIVLSMILSFLSNLLS